MLFLYILRNLKILYSTSKSAPFLTECFLYRNNETVYLFVYYKSCGDIPKNPK